MARKEREATTHEIAESFPVLQGDQRESLKDSIKRMGVINPIIVWYDEIGDKRVVDGRNRKQIVDEFVASGVTEADNGTPMFCQEYVVKGSERYALDFARAMNLQRRHLTSSQRAAIAVLHGVLAGRYDGNSAYEHPDGDASLEKIAKEAGTSRTYLCHCIKLYRSDTDLLNDVVSGARKIPDAMAELRKRQAPPAEPKADGDKPAAPEVLDGLKNPVPPEFTTIFRTRDEFRAAARQLKGLKKAIEALAESPGGKHVPVQMIGKDFENLSRSILDSAPFAICPHCTGNGLAGDPDHPKKKCGTCKGSGYLDRMQWRVLPDGVKASATVTA